LTALTMTYDSIEDMPAADAKAISKTLQTLFIGFTQRNADLLTTVYADDVDWVNAFGSVKHGRKAVIAYLHGLFADQNFNDGALMAPPQNHLRRLTDDIVTVSSHLKIAGQGLVDGGSIPVRDNHSLHVLQKQTDGQWFIVSEIYMDANTQQSYAGHS
jgi:uncharacterized protein (TIGR02246 family)